MIGQKLPGGNCGGFVAIMGAVSRAEDPQGPFRPTFAAPVPVVTTVES